MTITESLKLRRFIAKSKVENASKNKDYGYDNIKARMEDKQNMNLEKETTENLIKIYEQIENFIKFLEKEKKEMKE